MKKIYLHPELREKPLLWEGSFLATASSDSLEDGDVLNYDDDFWS